ncbi:MAG: EF2563 family selenium-dependent molybdenum hydroxylase system protein [Chloroflexi bacterium]|nr:EF2563 family selenium-dependent molybdenum hydroxylase system protein [Chloroflexota bacterium]
MLFPKTFCLIRGGGDLATGVAHRLHQSGFPVVVLELPQPRVVRRMASVAQAVFDGEFVIGDLRARRMELPDALPAALAVDIPVLVDPGGETIAALRPSVLVDARLTKAPADSTLDAASLVVGLGPGFVVGQNCHAVVETNRGHDLGRVMWEGAAQPDTGRPESVLGFERERVLRAPAAGSLKAYAQIGDPLQTGDLIAMVDGQAITAPFPGVLRGLIHDGLPVAVREKIGDLDPRDQRRFCFTISDKSLAVGGGVVEAVLTWLGKL